MRPSSIVLGLLVIGGSAAAQTPVTVVGIAFDSLHGRRLPNAFVTIGTSRSTMSDSTGIFRFDSVVPGNYRFAMQHDVMDSIGLSGATSRYIVSDGRDTVRVWVPSFTTLWREACGRMPAPADSGFIFGVVRSAKTRQPIAKASVRAAWVDLLPDLSQNRWVLDDSSDATGTYALCGLPTTSGTRVRSATDSLASGALDLLLTPAARIVRRDLFLGSMSATDMTTRGTIVGTVTSNGRPLGQAVVSVDGAAEIRTAENGRFILRNVPAGSRQLEIRSIGMEEQVLPVELNPGDTVRINATLERITILDSMRIKGTTVRERMFLDIDERRKVGLGKFRDSSEINQFGTVSTVLRMMPSTEVRDLRGGRLAVLFQAPQGAGKCLANFWLDGVKSDQEELIFVRPEDIAVIELYPRIYLAPAQYQDMSPKGARCGSMIIWTKRFAPGRRP